MRPLSCGGSRGLEPLGASYLEEKAHDKWSGAGRETGPALSCAATAGSGWYAKGLCEGASRAPRGPINREIRTPIRRELASPESSAARELVDLVPYSHRIWRARMPCSRMEWRPRDIPDGDARSSRAPEPPSAGLEELCQVDREDHADEAESAGRPRANTCAQRSRALYCYPLCRSSCGCGLPDLPYPRQDPKRFATEFPIC